MKDTSPRPTAIVDWLRDEWPVLLAVTASALAGLALYGVGDVGQGFWAMSRDYLNPGFDLYTRETVLFPLLMAALDAVGIQMSAARNLLFVVATAMGLAFGLRARIGRVRSALIACSLLLSTIGLILYSWAGMPDSLTVMATAIVCFARRPRLLAFAAFLGATNHLSQFCFIGLFVCALRGALEPGFGLREAAAILLGAATGAAAVKGLLWWLDVTPAHDRLALALQTPPSEWWSRFATRGWTSLYSFHHAHWLLLAVLVPVLAVYWRRALWLLLGCELLAVLLTVFTQDTTRVFALLGWFAPALVLVLSWERPETVPVRWQRRLVITLALSMALMAALPKIYVWNGVVHDMSRSRQLLRERLTASRDHSPRPAHLPSYDTSAH